MLSVEMSENATGDGEKQSRLEKRLAVAVLVAALASVPAVFLTTLDGIPGQAGHLINYASLAVLTGESVILLLQAGDRRRWLKENWFVVVVALLCIPAVIFAVGPAQLLRLLRFVGALRILRVRRIFKAGRILRERMGLTNLRSRVLGSALSLLAAVFVAIVLADPTSQSRRIVEGGVERVGTVGIVLAGAILAGATFVVVRYRHKLPIPAVSRKDGSQDGSGSEEGAERRLS